MASRTASSSAGNRQQHDRYNHHHHTVHNNTSRKDCRRRGHDQTAQSSVKPKVREFGAWAEYTSSAGKTYYYNSQTEVSQWEKPDEWIRHETKRDKHSDSQQHNVTQHHAHSGHHSKGSGAQDDSSSESAPSSSHARTSPSQHNGTPQKRSRPNADGGGTGSAIKRSCVANSDVVAGANGDSPSAPNTQAALPELLKNFALTLGIDLTGTNARTSATPSTSHAPAATNAAVVNSIPSDQRTPSSDKHLQSSRSHSDSPHRLTNRVTSRMPSTSTPNDTTGTNMSLSNTPTSQGSRSQQQQQRRVNSSSAHKRSATHRNATTSNHRIQPTIATTIPMDIDPPETNADNPTTTACDLLGPAPPPPPVPPSTASMIAKARLNEEVKPLPAITADNRLFDINLAKHTVGWASDLLDVHALDLSRTSVTVMSEVGTKCAELKCARSLVRTAEITCTLNDQRVQFARQQFLHLGSSTLSSSKQPQSDNHHHHNATTTTATASTSSGT